MWSLVDPRPEVPLGLGELGPVVDAEQPAVVLDRQAPRRPGRPPGRARRARSGTARRSSARAEVADPATAARPRRTRTGPALISLTASSSSVASLLLDDPLDGARLVADRPGPRSPGSIASTATSAIAAWSSAALLEQLVEQRGLEQRRVAGQDEDLVGVVGQRGHGGRDGVAGAARLGLEGVVDARRRARRGRPPSRGESRRAGAAAGGLAAGVDHVGDHRPAGQRVEQLRRRATSSACRGRRPGRPRRPAARSRDLGGSRGATRPGGSRGDRRDPDAVRARRVSVGVIEVGGS